MSASHEKWVEIKVPGSPEYIGILRLVISGFATRLGLVFEDIEDLKVAIGEGALSIMDCCNDSPEEIGFYSYVHNSTLYIKVWGTRKTCKLKGKDCISQGSMSYFLLETLMDSVEVKCDDVINIILTKRIRSFDEYGKGSDKY